jgi:hypothetical protein
VLSVEQLLLRGWKDITPQNFFFGLWIENNKSSECF